MSANIFALVQIILACILVGLIILQTKGTGLGSTFGGNLGFYSTKRGAEKMLFILTCAIATIFLLITLLRIFIVR